MGWLEAVLREVNGNSAAKGYGLTPSEDQELRQLTWFSRVGNLSERSRARLADLVSRDRRSEVRDPRPNPAAQIENGHPTSASAPGPDRISSMTCPNCGFVIRNDRP